MGDERWGGAYGIEADFWADGDCKVVHVLISEIKVRVWHCVLVPRCMPWSRSEQFVAHKIYGMDVAWK